MSKCPHAGCCTHSRRDFIVANYAEMKKANPHFPILIRECAGTEASLTARYGEPRVRGESLSRVRGLARPTHPSAGPGAGPTCCIHAARGDL